METNVLQIQMVTREEILAKKKNLFKQLTTSLPSPALISVSKEREGDRYIRFCFVGGTTNLCNLQITRRPAINVVGYKSLGQSMKITFKSKKFRGNAWGGLGMRLSTSC